MRLGCARGAVLVRCDTYNFYLTPTVLCPKSMETAQYMHCGESKHLFLKDHKFMYMYSNQFVHIQLKLLF